VFTYPALPEERSTGAAATPVLKQPSATPVAKAMLAIFMMSLSWCDSVNHATARSLLVRLRFFLRYTCRRPRLIQQESTAALCATSTLLPVHAGHNSPFRLMPGNIWIGQAYGGNLVSLAFRKCCYQDVKRTAAIWQHDRQQRVGSGHHSSNPSRQRAIKASHLAAREGPPPATMERSRYISF